MDKIRRIYQEIERLKKYYAECGYPGMGEYEQGNKQGRMETLDSLLSFLNTLSEEPVQKFNTDKLQEIAKPATPHKKPTPEDRAKFMEELHEYAESKKPDKSLEEAAEDYVMDNIPDFNPELYDGSLFREEDMNHAFIAGAEWQASQMPMPEDTVLFNKGVAEGRRLEREDSMECEVTDVGFNYLDLALFEAESLGLKEGDKVRIIIVKDESK